MATSIVEIITPAKAQEYLNASKGNRNISKAVVDSYATTMKSGKWLLNGEAIVFDVDGVLLNGHHRLYAVIKAGVPIQTFVTRGVEHESFTTFDCGRHRTVGQLIGMQGVKHYNAVSSSVQTSFRLSNGYSVGDNHSSIKAYNKTNSMMIELFNQDRDLYVKAATFGVEMKHRCNILDASIVGGVTHYLVRYGHYDFDFVKEFFDKICSLDTCSVRILDMLRKRLIENKTTLRKAPRSIIFALLTKTWNFYVTKTERKILSFDPEREEYPKFILNTQTQK